MKDRRRALASARRLGRAPYDSARIRRQLESEVAVLRCRPIDQRRFGRAVEVTVDVLDGLPGGTLEERWASFEEDVWPRWIAGEARPALGERWTWGVWTLVIGRFVRPSYAMLSPVRVNQWLDRLAEDDPLLEARRSLTETLASLGHLGAGAQQNAVVAGLRLLLVAGRDDLASLTEADVALLPAVKGSDGLDLALCELGVLDRGPLRFGARRLRTPRLSPRELAGNAGVPGQFLEVTALYLEAYATRVSGAYSTLRGKAAGLAHFFSYLDEVHHLSGPSEVRPVHARGFMEHARELSVARARRLRGIDDPEAARMTGHSWVITVRTFYSDVCTWATEPGSPFAGLVPPAVPLDRRDLRESGALNAKRQVAARMTTTVLDLEREMPNLRAFALRRWHEATGEAGASPGDAKLARTARGAFWDWALLELLVTSGLRVEEACELTTLDILRRRLADGRLYYLLHVKPSKFGRARVIPIGDVLGRVLAEIIRSVKAFHRSDAVPFVDRRDPHEKLPLPRAPYLLQGFGHPSAFGVNTVRWRLRRLSEAAGITGADGSPLILRPHDCRRMFASEQLNTNTPVHVIAALLGHTTLDTVMIYAKLYPSSLVEGYRKALRGVYTDVCGVGAIRRPSAEEWFAFSASCSLRDMGTHVCALPTGEHCSRGLVCLGCGHAQPKRSALPVFRRMLTSHERALVRARNEREPAGQVAARELEVERIRSAMHRAAELTEGVAEALEAV